LCFVKTPILLSLAALLITGCEKPEEKRSSISTTPKPEERLKPATTPQPEAPPPKPVASTQELEAFYAEVQAFEQKAAPLLKNPATTADSPELAALKEACDKLLAKRVKLTAGMTLEQRREVAKRSTAIREVSGTMMEIQLGKSTFPGQDVTPQGQPAAGGPSGPGATPPPKETEESGPPKRRTQVPP
jgi:hypothetical protein